MYTFFNILRFGGTPRKFDGTLVRRGTPVEKHWSKQLKMIFANYLGSSDMKPTNCITDFSSSKNRKQLFTFKVVKRDSKSNFIITFTKVH